MILFGYEITMETAAYAGAAAVLVCILFLLRSLRRKNKDAGKALVNEHIQTAEETEIETGTEVDMDAGSASMDKLRIELKALELRMAAVYKLFPQLSAIEKLDNYETLELTASEIEGLVSELLGFTRISGGEMDPGICEKKSSEIKDFDRLILQFVADRLSRIDTVYGKNIAGPGDYVHLGNARYLDGDYKKAFEYYDTAVKVKHDYAEAWNNRGAACSELGNQEEALKSFDSAGKIDPSSARALYGKGIVLGELGRHEEALACFEKAVELRPLYAEAWYDRGFALSSLGRHEEALRSFDRALSMDPGDARAWHGKGIAHSCLGMHEEAYKSYDNALSIKPDDAEAWYGRGIALNYLGQYEEAVKSFDNAITIKPADAKAWYGKGLARNYLGLADEALRAFDEALRLDATYARAWYNRARIYALNGETDRARTDLSKAAELEDRFREKALKDEAFSSIMEDTGLLERAETESESPEMEPLMENK